MPQAAERARLWAAASVRAGESTNSMRVSSNLGPSDTGTHILEVTRIGGGRLEVHDVISQSKPQPSFTHISLTLSLVPPSPLPWGLQ